jgi:hypothetical protein
MEEHGEDALWETSCWYIGQGAPQPEGVEPDDAPGTSNTAATTASAASTGLIIGPISPACGLAVAPTRRSWQQVQDGA